MVLQTRVTAIVEMYRDGGKTEEIMTTDEMIEQVNRQRKEKDPKYNEQPALQLPLSKVKGLLVDWSFFHVHKGGWKWVIPLKDGSGIILPVNPELPVTLLNSEAFQSDLKEFSDEAKQQKNDYANQQNILLEQMQDLIKE